MIAEDDRLRKVGVDLDLILEHARGRGDRRKLREIQRVAAAGPADESEGLAGRAAPLADEHPGSGVDGAGYGADVSDLRGRSQLDGEDRGVDAPIHGRLGKGPVMKGARPVAGNDAER